MAYQNFAHKGSGRKQSIGDMAAGANPRSKLRASKPMPHATSSSKDKNYDWKAHSGVHHSQTRLSSSSKAIGKHPDARPFNYKRKLQSEGAPRPGHIDGGGPARVGDHGHARSIGSGATAHKLIDGSTKAHHHPSASKTPHVFQGVNSVTGSAHGYGHPSHLRKGALRMSGHSGAHRIGGK